MQYYLYGEWHNIDSYIDYGTGVQKTSRIDDSFATCTFKAYLSESQNIPPYTLFKDGLIEQWVGKSRVIQYLSEQNLYVHEFSLLDPVAFLKCFIIGVKVYSKESPTWGADSEKFKSLLTQAQRMYSSYTFNYGASINNRILTSKTYTFDATATLYDCLNQICQENELKLDVYFYNDDPETITINVKGIVSGSYPLTSSDLRIIDHTEDQDSENYCKYLETYASNVVDRTTITRCDYVYAKADDILLNADTAKVFTPTAIESVVDFGIRQTLWNGSLTLKGLNNFFSTPFTTPSTRTYGELATTIQCQVNGQTVYFFDYVYENEIKRYFPDVSKATFYSGVTFDNTQPNWSDGSINFRIISSMKGKFTKMSALLEKGQWEALTPQDQATRVFYTIGGNTIENLNGSYKNDFWNTIIGQSRGNFLTEFQSCSNYILDGNLEVAYYLDYSGVLANNLTNLVFFIEYKAITNPYIRVEKTQQALNETNYKPLARSYGISANYIDFDKLMPNMEIANNTLGEIEKVYEVDLTGVTDTSLNDPKGGNLVTINNNNWYISSCVRTKKFSGGKDTAILTLVRNYSKKADAIGVDSQEESTNNPLHGITTRDIFYDVGATYYGDLESQGLYIRFTFYDTNNNVITNTNYDSSTLSSLIARCSVQSTTDYYLVYCSMLDQMLFDFERGSGTDNITQYPMRYTNLDAEVGYVEMSLGTMSVSSGNGLNLPSGSNGTFTQLLPLLKIKIDKDAREQLTFSIMLKRG